MLVRVYNVFSIISQFDARRNVSEWLKFGVKELGIESTSMRKKYGCFRVSDLG